MAAPGPYCPLTFRLQPPLSGPDSDDSAPTLPVFSLYLFQLFRGILAILHFPLTYGRVRVRSGHAALPWREERRARKGTVVSGGRPRLYQRDDSGCSVSRTVNALMRAMAATHPAAISVNRPG